MDAFEEPVTAGEPALATNPMQAHLHDGKRAAAALIRIARELREAVVADCIACRDRIPRNQIEGTDPPKYVHRYGGNPGTCAPCTNDVEQGVLDDIDTVAEIGYWIYATQPIMLPLTVAAGQPLTVGVDALTGRAVLGRAHRC